MRMVYSPSRFAVVALLVAATAVLMLGRLSAGGAPPAPERLAGHSPGGAAEQRVAYRAQMHGGSSAPR